MLNEIDLARTDLNLLGIFEAVASERHVGRAARRLNLSPSAVSHSLGRLRRLLNDPLFLRTPRGVVPTERAEALIQPISDVLAQVRSLLASTEPFDPRRSARRFLIGAPDGVSVIFLAELLAKIRLIAPGISVGIRQLLPIAGESAPDRAWRGAFEELEARVVDIAVIPTGIVPRRFDARELFQEDFVVAMRDGHAYGFDPTLERYCDMRHLVVSMSGDANGFVDDVLAAHGLCRNVVATVPTFMFALSAVSETDLISALPRRLVALYGSRFGISSVEPPIPFGNFRLHTVIPNAALADPGIEWLRHILDDCGRSGSPAFAEAPEQMRRSHAPDPNNEG